MNPETLSLKTVINELDMLKKEVIIQWNVWKIKLLLLALKLIEKIPDPHNVKEHHNIRKKNTQSVNQKKITYQPNTFENPNIVDIKSVIIEHSQISHKLSKAIRQTEKVSQVDSNSSLYNDTKEVKIFWMKKM